MNLPLPLTALRTPLLIAAGLALASLIGLAVWTQVQLDGERAAHEKTKADHAKALAAAERSARQWEGRANELADRAREDNDAAQRTISQQAAELAAQRARIARLSADADGLRQQFAAARAARGAQDSLASCVAWAGTLEDALARGAGLVAQGVGLLAEGARLAGQSAEAHDRRAAEVTALIRGWPHLQSTPGVSP